MKNLFTFIIAAAFLAFTIPQAPAQAVGPQRISAVTNAAMFSVWSGQTTNLTAGQKNKLRLNGDGFAFSAVVGCTNAVTTSNITVRFQFSVDGSNLTTQFFPTFIFQPGGGTLVNVATNFPADLTRNYDYVSVFSIQNTNEVAGTATNLPVWFTNMVLRVNRAR